MINIEKKEDFKPKILLVAKDGIKIKKENQGKFTDYCGGKVTQDCIDKAKRSNNPKLVKRAVFAENARKWKHADGGVLLAAKGAKTDEAYKRKWVSEMRKAYEDEGITNQDSIDLLVALDAHETAWGTKTVGEYNYGNIKDLGHLYADSIQAYDKKEKSNDWYRSFSSPKEYVQRKLRLLGGRLYSINFNSDDLDTIISKLLGQNPGKRRYATDPEYARLLKNMISSVKRRTSYPLGESLTTTPRPVYQEPTSTVQLLPSYIRDFRGFRPIELPVQAPYAPPSYDIPEIPKIPIETKPVEAKGSYYLVKPGEGWSHILRASKVNQPDMTMPQLLMLNGLEGLELPELSRRWREPKFRLRPRLRVRIGLSGLNTEELDSQLRQNFNEKLKHLNILRRRQLASAMDIPTTKDKLELLDGSARTIYQGLKDLGYSSSTSSGILGNIGVESGFNQNAHNGQSRSGAFGFLLTIGPRTTLSVRLYGGSPYLEPKDTVLYIHDWIQGKHEHEGGFASRFRNSNLNSPASAADAWDRHFERSQDYIKLGHTYKNRLRLAQLLHDYYESPYFDFE